MARWVRLEAFGESRYGLIEGDAVALYDGLPWASPVARGRAVPLAGTGLLAPVQPSLFVGLWNNFHAAAAKAGNAIPSSPLYFLKSPGSIAAPEAEISPPAGYAGRTLYEGELGVVIGRRCARVDDAEAEAAIFGYTCVNDVTALDLLSEDASFAQWARAKSCDGFGPVGPAIATGLDWRDLTIRTRLGGRERQNYPASDMIFSPPAIISLISREMTLHPGDVIACGTSLGALPMRPGMVVEVEIDGIGVLRNTMAPAPAAAA
jgi:2-keto-4-pentenoate hydratase/2-oxohepta-3-ene-1,7-dioic acid hydratase in catechol pathway